MYCKICNSPCHKRHFFKEKQFAFGDTFLYGECGKCGALFLEEVPNDLWRFYPDTYYSYGQTLGLKTIFIKSVLRFFLRLRCVWLVKKIVKIHHPLYSILSLGKINYDASILDVGCWSGELLRILNLLGYSNLVWLDPFLAKSQSLGGVSLLKKSIFELDEKNKYDLIMFHHSLEHMQDHREVLNKVNSLLKSTWSVIIRIPIKSIFFELYQGNWIGIDAPRHMIIHSMESFKTLIEQTDFRIKKYYFDSHIAHFTVSEAYKLWVKLDDISFISDALESRKYQSIIDYYNTTNTMGGSIVYILEKNI